MSGPQRMRPGVCRQPDRTPWLRDASGQATPRLRDASGQATARLRDASGQATVELVAVLPLLVALLAGLWQAVLVGQAVWAASAAARSAARAHAIGGDPASAAREHLPGALEEDLRVTAAPEGEVRVSVRIPGLPGLPSPGRTGGAARFEPQS